MELLVQNEATLPKVAAQILGFAGDIRLWLFYGNLGAGKTTLIKAVGKKLGITEPMSSPTFSLVNEYQTIDGEPVFHMDFYRIKKEQEAIDLGYEEYFFSGYYCMVEWPDKIPNLLPEQYLEVSIDPEGENTRRIKLKIYDEKK